MAQVDPKVAAEMSAHVGPALLALSRAIRSMRAKRVPLDDEVFRRASFARASLMDLQTALAHEEALRSPGLFDPPMGEGWGEA